MWVVVSQEVFDPEHGSCVSLPVSSRGTRAGVGGAIEWVGVWLGVSSRGTRAGVGGAIEWVGVWLG